MTESPAREGFDPAGNAPQSGRDDQAEIDTRISGCTPEPPSPAAVNDPGATADYQPAFDADLQKLSSAPLPSALVDHPRYDVTRVLGRGGMGTVYKARHRLLDRLVVLKLIRPELLHKPGVTVRFEREARLAAKLSHPNVVSIYEAERLDDTLLLVMEYVDGVNLAQFVLQRGLLPVAEACELIRQAAIGLQHIHEQHLVHRDIKPSNMLVSPAGIVKILDLGLAMLKTGKSDGSLTAEGQFLGTVDYAAPEQWESSHEVDIRADVYSLGCSLYFMLAGQSPFPSSKYSTTMQQMWAHSHAPLPPICEFRPDVPAALSQIVQRMLAKNPADRLATAAEVAAALQPFTEGCDLAEFVRTERKTTTSQLDLSRVGSSLEAKPAPGGTPAVRWPRRTLVAGVGAVVFSLMLLMAIFRPGRTSRTASDSPGQTSSTAQAGVVATVPSADHPIKVGILHSQTGTMSISERAVIDATLLAIDEINQQGGVLGRLVEPVIEDGESDWEVFADKAEKLITQDKVCTIFGCWTSASRKTVLPVVESHRHLLFYPVQYEGLEQSPNIVYTGAAPNQQIIPAVKWARTALNKKRFFLVGTDYIFPRCANAIIRDTATDLNIEVVGEEYLTFGSADVNEIVRKITDNSPDLILNTVNGDSNVALFRALRAAGITSDKVPTISFSISEEELSSLKTRDVAGDYAAWNYFQSLERPQNVSFVERFKARYGKQRTISDPMEAAYFGVHLWAQAVAAAGSEDVQKIRVALKHQQFDAPEGIVRIDPETQHTSKIFRVGRVTREGRFEVVYSSEIPIAPLPYPKTRQKAEWDEFLTDLHLRWGGNWANPGKDN